MKKGNSYKLMKGTYKPHKGAVKTAKFAVQKVYLMKQAILDALEKGIRSNIRRMQL